MGFLETLRAAEGANINQVASAISQRVEKSPQRPFNGRFLRAAC